MSASLAPVETYCRDCGSVIQSRAEICPKCGVRQRVAQVSGRNRSSAAIFAFFLGWLGVHKFYLGQTGAGVVYLLFFWTLVPGFIAFIEGIVYLSMSDAEFNARYNVVL